jgi:hypothetical protein
MYRALGPLIDVSRSTGAHLAFTHHSGKNLKADVIDSPLGSTAIAGAVSTLIVLKRREAYRTIETRQRIGEDLPETVLGFDATTRLLSLGGSRFEADRAECEADILEFLRDAAEPKTQAQIREGVEGRTSILRAALTALVTTEQVKKSGEGIKGKAFLYEFPDSGSHIYGGNQKTRIHDIASDRINTGGDVVPANSEKPILVPATEGGAGRPSDPPDFEYEEGVRRQLSEKSPEVIGPPRTLPMFPGWTDPDGKPYALPDEYTPKRKKKR